MRKYKDRASVLLDKAKKGDSAFTKQTLTKQEKIDLERLNKGVLDTENLEVSNTELLIMKWYRECFDKPLIHKGFRVKSNPKKQSGKMDYRSCFYDNARKYDNAVDYSHDDFIGLSLWFISNSAAPDVNEFMDRIIDPCIVIATDKDTPEDVKYAPFRILVSKYVCKVIQRYYEGYFDEYSEPYSDPLGMFPSEQLLYSLLTQNAITQYPLGYRAIERMRVNWEQCNGFNYLSLKGDRVDDTITPPPQQTLKLQKSVVLQSIEG